MSKDMQPDASVEQQLSGVATPFLEGDLLTARPAFHLNTELKGKPAYRVALSRRDSGMVSYFPGLELKNNPAGDWIELVLIPALLPVARRKTRLISQVPITVWVTVRSTARRSRGEIFLFITPAHGGITEKIFLKKDFDKISPGKGWIIPGGKSWSTIQQALGNALETIHGGNIQVGREDIPAGAYPCLQIFRGKIIEFYLRASLPEPYYVPVIHWGKKAPLLNFSPFSRIPAQSKGLSGERILARADVSSQLDGNYFRIHQQFLNIKSGKLRLEVRKIEEDEKVING